MKKLEGTAVPGNLKTLWISCLPSSTLIQQDETSLDNIAKLTKKIHGISPRFYSLASISENSIGGLLSEHIKQCKFHNEGAVTTLEKSDHVSKFS